jgi:hypothetical protein
MKPGLSIAQKIIVKQSFNSHVQVEAPLPEQYGLSLGNEISAPFGAYALSNDLIRVMALYGISTSVGMTTTKFFTGLQQPDISTELQFRAYHSAMDDVVAPVIALAYMASGIFMDTAATQKIGGKISITGIITDILNEIGTGVDLLTDLVKAPPPLPHVSENSIKQIFRLVKGPSTVDVRFGNVFSLSQCYISSFSVNFSNELDYEDMPTSADVSLTLTPKVPLDAAGVFRAFGAPRSKSPPSASTLAKIKGE